MRGFLQGYSGASPPPLPPSPLALPQPLSLPGLGMAELSPALESGFTATETAFPPLQSTTKPAVSRPLNSQTGRFCPRPMHPQARRRDALRTASPPFISLQASLDQPASPPDRPSFLLRGKENSPATAHLQSEASDASFFCRLGGFGNWLQVFSLRSHMEKGCCRGRGCLLGSAAATGLQNIALHQLPGECSAVGGIRGVPPPFTHPGQGQLSRGREQGPPS